jgi:hypothetical protein
MQQIEKTFGFDNSDKLKSGRGSVDGLFSTVIGLAT